MGMTVLGRWFAPVVLGMGMGLGLTMAAAPAVAAVVVYDFDAFADLDPLANQLAGFSFSNATVVKAGQTLNEFELPPRSGDGVVFDDGGAISISFSAPVFAVGGYFTYFAGLSMRAFDGSSNVLGTVTSLFGANSLLSGDGGSSPNELLQLVSATGAIARVEITGDPVGGSFVLDDLTVDSGNRTVPEPQTLLLALALLGAGSLPRGWMRRRHSA